jgi:hypothetical protein
MHAEKESKTQYRWFALFIRRFNSSIRLIMIRFSSVFLVLCCSLSLSFFIFLPLDFTSLFLFPFSASATDRLAEPNEPNRIESGERREQRRPAAADSEQHNSNCNQQRSPPFTRAVTPATRPAHDQTIAQPLSPLPAHSNSDRPSAPRPSPPPTSAMSADRAAVPNNASLAYAVDEKDLKSQIKHVSDADRQPRPQLSRAHASALFISRSLTRPFVLLFSTSSFILLLCCCFSSSAGQGSHREGPDDRERRHPPEPAQGPGRLRSQ